MSSSSLPEVINSWFAVARSEDIPAGSVKAIHLMGHRLVIFRTEDGKLAAMDGACPHLGGSLAQSGTVEGGVLRCRLHGFCFDTAGQCTETGYGTKPPPLKARTYPVREMLGTVLLYFHETAETPTWEPPLDDGPIWSRPTHDVFSLTSHPQEIAENAVDTGHLTWIHGFSEATRTGPLEVDGHRVRQGIRCRVPNKLGVGGGADIEMDFAFHVYGLGIVIVESHVPSVDFFSRTFVMSSLVGDGTMDVRVVSQCRDIGRSTSHLPLKWLMPERAAERLLLTVYRRAMLFDFRRDLVYWAHKRYLPRPGLASGDGPIVAFRRWAKQFYPRGFELPMAPELDVDGDVSFITPAKPKVRLPQLPPSSQLQTGWWRGWRETLPDPIRKRFFTGSGVAAWASVLGIGHRVRA
ncbi:MAG: Rieske 2Fe-2S domain-containing protein [Polyangiaceae bacterium]|nr:Rieske 2Fe-2S domain-containing protein [Polyangiaceae bacterium]